MDDRSLNPRVNMVLVKLNRVRKAGKGFVAQCPGHEDRSASLSICEGRDGRVLLNCFAGCSPLSILNAVGMQMQDLYNNPPKEDLTPEERVEVHEQFMRAKWDAALTNLEREANFVLICARALDKGETLDVDTQRRLYQSVRLISDARTTLSTGPARPRRPFRQRPQDKK